MVCQGDGRFRWSCVSFNGRIVSADNLLAFPYLSRVSYVTLVAEVRRYHVISSMGSSQISMKFQVSFSFFGRITSNPLHKAANCTKLVALAHSPLLFEDI